MQIFFDLDGTLVDISQKYYRVYADITIFFGGVPMPIGTYWRMKRAHTSVSQIAAKSLLPSHVSTRFIQECIRRIELHHYTSLDTLFPYTIATLKTLALHHHELHLISARKNSKHAHAQVERLGLVPVFISLAFGDTQQAIKPLIHPHTPFMIIGDTEEEIEIAKNLGGISVAVLSGIRNKKILSLYNPTYIATDIRGVPL